MELHLRSHHYDVGRPDWLAGVAAGFVAGAIMMVLELLWSATALGGTPWTTAHRIAAIVMGERALHPINDFSISVIAVALAIHYLLGVFTGVVAAVILSGFHVEDNLERALLIGLVLGVVIYCVNFYVMTNAFPWFVDMRGSATMVAHMIFGISAGATYWYLERAEHMERMEP
jgi:hypothetical protein